VPFNFEYKNTLSISPIERAERARDKADEKVKELEEGIKRALERNR